MRRLFVLSCGFYLLIGITSVILGPLLPTLLKHYERNYSDGGTLLFLQFIGFLVGVLVSPMISARLGRKTMLLIALISIAAAAAVIGFLPAWAWVIAMTLCIGFGSGMIESSIGAFTIEFAEQGKAVAMTKLDVYFGVGALLIPIAASLYIRFDVWQFTFFSTSAITLVLMLLWMTMPAESSRLLRIQSAESPDVPAEKKRYHRKQIIVLTIFVVFFFVYMGLELGLMNFLPSILIETTSVNESLASLSVTMLWVAMVIGRLFVGKIAESIRYIPFLLWSTLGTLFFTIAMLVISNEIATYLLIFAIGIFMSGLFSITLVYANSLIPGMTERTTSILIAAGGIGGAVLQYGIGWGMTRWPAISAIWILAGFSFVLLLAIGLSHQWNVRSKSSDSSFTI
ncbi:MFS transporter [Paenibacillus sp. GCM10012307]|uniref:MFS transporter n=1 Tax=Paenibacillus roseus TaxID=2798579 RepID=A0A934IVD8_9BACL|nr:MFS transporter [Paenibacillus roseus]MBJ6360017.1 MFS transporter [Paenibacillus roseus]